MESELEEAISINEKTYIDIRGARQAEAPMEAESKETTAPFSNAHKYVEIVTATVIHTLQPKKRETGLLCGRLSKSKYQKWNPPHNV